MDAGTSAWRFEDQCPRGTARNSIEQLERRTQVIEDAEEQHQIERAGVPPDRCSQRASLMLDHRIEHLVGQQEAVLPVVVHEYVSEARRASRPRRSHSNEKEAVHAPMSRRSCR